MKKTMLFVIAALSLLFGCAAQPEPGVKVVVQEVKVPVREVCIQSSDLPKREDYITVQVQKNDRSVTKTKKLIVHYKQSETYIKTLEALLVGCSK